jgi:hypothetical protein
MKGQGVFEMNRGWYCFPYMELISFTQNLSKRDAVVTRNSRNMIAVPADDVSTRSNKDTRRDSGISIVIIFFCDIIGRSPGLSTDLEKPSYSEEPLPSMGALSSAANVTRNVKLLLALLHLNKLANSGPSSVKVLYSLRHSWTGLPCNAENNFTNLSTGFLFSDLTHSL